MSNRKISKALILHSIPEGNRELVEYAWGRCGTSEYLDELMENQVEETRDEVIKLLRLLKAIYRLNGITPPPEFIDKVNEK